MKAIHLAVLILYLFQSSAILAQKKDDDSQNPERIFKKLRIDFAVSGIRFTGKKETGVEHSKTGYGFHIQPAWNITDNHSVGLKMVGSYHDEKNGTDHFSLLANYTYTYFGGADERPDRIERWAALYGGTGIGFTNEIQPVNDSTIKNNAGKTSFAIMPYLGIRYGKLCADGHYHLAVGNKQNTYFGISFGVMIGGGLHNTSSIKK